MENVDLARENNEFGKKRETILDHRHTGMYELALCAPKSALGGPSAHSGSALALPTLHHDHLVVSQSLPSPMCKQLIF